MTPTERIRRLMESGSVAPEEGARLIDAISRRRPASRLSTLVDPFERFGGGVAATLGGIVSVASVALALYFGVRFDGMLDLHFDLANPPTLQVAVVDQIAAWLVPALCFWLYARAVGRNARLVDFVGTTGLARLPISVGALVLVPLVQTTIAAPTAPSPSLVALVLVTVVVFVANVTWLYRGFKNASGLEGAKHVGGFIGLVVVAEMASKATIWALSKS